MSPACRIERGCSGFTLVEVLVALAVFAIASLIAYCGLNAVASTKTLLERDIRFWRDLGLVFERMESDFGQSVPHPLPTGPDTLALPLRGASASGFFIEFMRLDGSRPPLHVLYRCDRNKEGNGKLTLALAPVNRGNAADAPSVTRTVLLYPVERCEASFLDAANVWRSEWPGVQSPLRPRAIRIRLALDGYGLFERVYPLP